VSDNTIFSKPEKGTDGCFTPCVSSELISSIPSKFLRSELDLPTIAEPEVVRHFTRLSRLNFSVDTHFYPLGSCTMKYNPKINEDTANFLGFSSIHPYQNEASVQGALGLMFSLEKLLCEITGMSRFSFQGAAGAHGEFIGMLIVGAYHKARGNKRTKVIVPDSAHGTNPATAAMCGYDVSVVKSTEDGLVDLEELKKIVDNETAALMLTNPNTLGLFEEQILEISKILHEKGALLYYDGANFNPLLGITNPALMGFDIVHLNLHKTFSTPHGSGGPGSGVVGVKEELVDFLPAPLINKKDDKFCLEFDIKNSVGRVKAFYGNFLVLVKAYTYILRLGKEGLKRVAQNSVLNANYIKEKLKDKYNLASQKTCMHEVVFSCTKQKERGASALDIAKRLIDFDIHPPTMYFPLIAKEALMVEPTETESKETLDNFIEIMRMIDKEIDEDLSRLKESPQNAPVRRLDETQAARFPDLRWKKIGD